MSTATALATEKTHWETQAASIDDAGEKLEALSAIAEWYDCAIAVAALSAHDVSSYSYGGKSVSRKDLPSLAAHRDALKAAFKSLLGYGGCILVDARDTTDSVEVRTLV